MAGPASRTGLLDQAQASYRRAVALQPEMAPPHAHLAALAALRADWAETRACAGRALALDPRQTTATLALAACRLRRESVRRCHRALNALLESEFAQPEDCVAARMLLGDIYDRLGRTDEAFAAYAAGNALTRSLQKSRFARPGVQTMPEYVAMLAEHFARVPPWPSPAIPGRHDGNPRGTCSCSAFPRSGTTLLEEMLATLPGAVTTQERDGLGGGRARFHDRHRRSRRARRRGRDAARTLPRGLLAAPRAVRRHAAGAHRHRQASQPYGEAAADRTAVPASENPLLPARSA